MAGAIVISLPHSSGPGIVVGGEADRCRTCLRLTNARYTAWVTHDWDGDARARHAFLGHWEESHLESARERRSPC
ncbi:hypothetical protein [Streptomyces sp. NPDC002537]